MNKREIEDILRTVGIDFFRVHEVDIPAGEYWLGREYQLHVTSDLIAYKFRSMLHRENGPALIQKDGSLQKWLLFDKLHRADGPAVTRIVEGKTYEEYYYYGMPHRVGGPALQGLDGSFKWYYHGRMHREDGPAWVIPNGPEVYAIDGVELDQDEYLRWVEKYKNYPLIIW